MQCDFMEPGFWNTFVENNWEKKAFSSNTVFKTAPIDEESLFQSVVKCVDKFNSTIGIRLYIGLVLQKIIPGHHLLPKTADRSFAGYNRRMEEELGDKKYCLVLNSIEVLDFSLWDWSREFLSGLYGKIGFNKLGTYNALFIGNYDKTPFGVHLDPESVFHIPVIGKKTMRTWPNSYRTNHPGIVGAHDYQEYLADSTKIEAVPGGLLYWPSESWHISEKSADFSVSLALSLNCFSNILPGFLKKIDAYAKQISDFSPDIVVPFNPAKMQESAGNFPDDLRLAADFMQKMASETALRCEWIKLVTGFNFLTPPEPEPVDSLSVDSAFAGSEKYPVVYVKMGDKLVISANGHLVKYDYNKHLIDLIVYINQGNIVTVSSLTEKFSMPDAAVIPELLRWLKSVRAIKAEVEEAFYI